MMAAEAFVVETHHYYNLAETVSVRSKGKERCLKLARRLGLQFVGKPNLSRNESIATRVSTLLSILSASTVYVKV